MIELAPPLPRLRDHQRGGGDAKVYLRLVRNESVQRLMKRLRFSAGALSPALPLPYPPT